MQVARSPRFPAPALGWLLGDQPRRVLVLQTGTGMVKALRRAGHEVVAVAAREADLRPLTAVDQVVGCTASVQDLPFAPCSFDVVLMHQIRVPSSPRVLSELARVLRPQGWIAWSHLGRDDSVPWVRRLIELMRSIDATAMGGGAAGSGPASVSDDAHAGGLASKYFPVMQSHDFRVWVPISREEMVSMVAGHPAVADLDAARRAQLLGAVTALHDGASTASELRLPYQLRCWRAPVDHAELTTPIRLSDGALVIQL